MERDSNSQRRHRATRLRRACSIRFAYPHMVGEERLERSRSRERHGLSVLRLPVPHPPASACARRARTLAAGAGLEPASISLTDEVHGHHAVRHLVKTARVELAFACLRNRWPTVGRHPRVRPFKMAKGVESLRDASASRSFGLDWPGVRCSNPRLRVFGAPLDRLSQLPKGTSATRTRATLARLAARFRTARPSFHHDRARRNEPSKRFPRDRGSVRTVSVFKVRTKCKAARN